MGFVIFAVTAIAVLLVGFSKKSSEHNKKHIHSETAEERKRRETDELITVIVPTIRDDQ